MENTVELLRNLAGIMFWAFTDFFLGACWLALIFGVIISIIKGSKKDD